MERIIQSDLNAMGVPPHLFFRVLLDATTLPYQEWVRPWDEGEISRRVYLMCALESYLLRESN